MPGDDESSRSTQIRATLEDARVNIFYFSSSTHCTFCDCYSETSLPSLSSKAAPRRPGGSRRAKWRRQLRRPAPVRVDSWAPGSTERHDRGSDAGLDGRRDKKDRGLDSAGERLVPAAARNRTAFADPATDPRQPRVHAAPDSAYGEPYSIRGA